MEWHAEKTLSGTVNLHTRKWSNFTKFQVLAWLFINSQASTAGISWRNVRSLLAYRGKMLAFGTNWTTWHSIVGQQTCKISHRNGLRHVTWRLARLISYLHWSHIRFPTILSWGKHCTALWSGFVPRLWFCWWLGGLEINPRRRLVNVWKQNICSCQLDVQEGKFCLAQFYRPWDYFLDAGLRMGGLFALDLWDMVIEVLRSTIKNVKPNHSGIQEIGANLHCKIKTENVRRRQKVAQLSDVDHVPTNTCFSRWVSVAQFLKTTKPWSKWFMKDEVQRWHTCPEPTEVPLIGCSTWSIWKPRSKSNLLTPETNSHTFWPREHHETNGINFFVCSTLISRCSLVAFLMIFFLTIRLESIAPCQNEVKKQLRTKALRWWKRDHAWWRVTRGLR